MRGRRDAQAKRTALWVHLYDPHDPYEPPEPFASRFADRLYDGEVAWTDTLLGRLRAGLEARQLWDDALVVVTADHGEALGEHDETGHGFFAYETTLQRAARHARARWRARQRTVDGTLRLVDVAPTVARAARAAGAGRAQSPARASRRASRPAAPPVDAARPTPSR